MPIRQAACDPCRISKLACDHARPSCGRCTRRNQIASCIYRSTPFAKRSSIPPASQQGSATLRSGDESNGIAASDMASVSVSSHYPNPGYLGHFSHTTIFGQFPPAVNGREENSASGSIARSIQNTKPALEEIELLRGQHLLEEIHRSVSIQSCVGLVQSWLAGGSNLALAGPFIKLAAQSTETLFDEQDGQTQSARRLSEHLFCQSSSIISLGINSTVDNFCDQFCFANTRWETLGLFFTAVSMATCEVARHPGQFTSQQQRQHLRKLALRLADQCLAFSLTLDCLNDLQLILQYENFINHSFTHGDQSFDSWKRLGDTISSIYALGYHEHTRADNNCPKFLRHIREAVFAFTYSADKNVSIFLGRPPRMQRRYCNFDFLDRSDIQQVSDANSELIIQYLGWNADCAFDYAIEAWWSVTCALQKEEVLQIYREKDQAAKNHQVSIVRIEVQQSWSALPSQFRRPGKLMASSYLPIERDFTASARLNHLHVLFLLELSLSRSNTEPEPALLVVSAAILTLITEENMIKEHLANSGTGLIWRIAYYGLPAAGILCLSLLNGMSQPEKTDLAVTRIFRDLATLVAQVEAGGLVDSTDPNYALIFEATETIKTIIDKTLLTSVHNSPPNRPRSTQPTSLTGPDDMEMWAPWTNGDILDFEAPFWTNLAEHPSLISPENGIIRAPTYPDTM